MNLKNFKKVHDDEEKAILRNDKGHEIRVAKKGLTDKHRKDLDNLQLHAADGADLEETLNNQDSLREQALNSVKEAPQPTAPQTIAPKPQEVTQPDVTPMPETAAPEPIPSPSLPQMEVQKRPEQVREEAKQKYIADHASEMGVQDAKWGQDLENGHVQAKTYSDLFAEKSTLGKIGTIFGLMLEGIGSGMTHQPSQALQMMNNVVQQDLDAQKQSKGNAQNYMSLSYQHELQKAQQRLSEAQATGVDADTALKNAQVEAFYRANGGARNKASIAAIQALQDQVNKFPNGPDKLKAQQLLDGIKQANAQEILQTNKKIATSMADDPEGSFNARQKQLMSTGMIGLPGGAAVAENEASKHVPGFGNASIPVPSDVRQELIAKQEYDKAAKAYVDFAKKHQNNWANMNPKERLEIARKGAVLGAELQGKYRLKTKGGVYKEGEQKYIESIIPSNAASWSASFNQIPKVEQTLQDNQMETKNLAAGYGLHAPGEKRHSVGADSEVPSGMKKQFNPKTGQYRLVPR